MLAPKEEEDEEEEASSDAACNTDLEGAGEGDGVEAIRKPVGSGVSCEIAQRIGRGAFGDVSRGVESSGTKVVELKLLKARLPQLVLQV
jgi:hypothetical protein